MTPLTPSPAERLARKMAEAVVVAWERAEDVESAIPASEAAALPFAAFLVEAQEVLRRAADLLDCWNYDPRTAQNCREGNECPACLVAGAARALLSRLDAEMGK